MPEQLGWHLNLVMRMILITTERFCPLLIEKHTAFPVSSFPEDGTRTVITFYTHPPKAGRRQRPRGSCMDTTEPSHHLSDPALSRRALIGTVLIPMVTKLYIFFKWLNHYLQTRVCPPWDLFVFSEIIITTTLGSISKKNWKKIQGTLTAQALQNLMYLASFHFQEENRWHWANWMKRGGK